MTTAAHTAQKLSIAAGDTGIPLLEETLGHNLTRAVAKYPDN